MKKIKFTIPHDNQIFQELWTPQADATAKMLNLDIQFRDTNSNINKFLSDADGIITSWGAPCFNHELLKDCPQLKIIAHAAGSVADVVCDETYERGIKVVSANDIMAQSVAEWSVMMSLLGAKKLTQYVSMGGIENEWASAKKATGTLKGATIGIWGYGAITSKLIPMLKVFEPKEILLCSGYLTKERAEQLGVKLATLEDIFAQSDVIHLLSSLNSNNINRIDKTLLGRIKDGASLINGGRAALIDEQDLLCELKKARFTAIFDVFHKEPLPNNSIMYDFENVIITPHCAGRASFSFYVIEMLKELGRFFNNENLLYEVPREKARSMTSHKKVSELFKKHV